MHRLLYFAILFLLLNTIITAQTTIRICALRVDFQEDQNSLTTGNGKFMVDTVTTKPFAIDPAPHDRTFFADQIHAAANYFKSVSDGKIFIEGDVFPTSLNGSYTLPNKMGHYNPNTGEADANTGLAELFQDALQVADQDNNIVFDNYDLVVIFHAGVGKDIDIGFDETPQDIPSLYLTEDFFKNTLGENFTGILVDDGKMSINYGIILPETENQVGYQIAITGILVSNIGTHLGLPDLFSPATQRSGVGRFDLMDVGLLNLNGLAPSPPGAYSRERLGWSIPETVESPEEGIQIARMGTGSPELVKIPLNDTEYYLIEYRGLYNVNIDSLYFELYQDRNEEPSYLEVLSTYYPEWIEVSDSSGVVLKLENYDVGLPGSGILIWHIDQRIIQENEASNKINDDPDFRGVDIEEADGSQDIGESYNITQAGFQSELGTWLDFWFKGDNDENTRPLYQNKFSTFTSPNTRSNLNNAVSHISIENFSSNKTDIMSFDYSRGYIEEDFPVTLPVENIKVSYQITGKISGKAAPFTFFLTDDGSIWSVGAGGKGLLRDDALKLGHISAEEGFTSVALASREGNNLNDLLIAGGDSLYIYDLTASNEVLVEFIPPVELQEFATGPVVTDEGAIYVPVTRARYQHIQLDGSSRLDSLPSNDTGHITDFFVFEGQPYLDIGKGYNVGFFDEETGGLNRISYLEQPAGGKFVVNSTDLFEWEIEEVLAGPFALADIEYNGRFNIVYTSSRKIHALNQFGNPVTNFPIEINLEESDSLLGCPLIADLDGNGLVDIVTVSKSGLVFAYSTKGELIQGFPLNAGENITGTPILTNWDNDPDLELVVVLSSGIIYAWSIPMEQESSLIWTQSRLNSANNALVEKNLTPIQLNASLMPVSMAFNYPNPNESDFTTIRYYLNDAADVKIRIFDAAGILVDDFNGPGFGGMANEVDWNLGDIASGVYLCQIEATGGGKKESRIIKIMVIH